MVCQQSKRSIQGRFPAQAPYARRIAERRKVAGQIVGRVAGLGGEIQRSRYGEGQADEFAHANLESSKQAVNDLLYFCNVIDSPGTVVWPV